MSRPTEQRAEAYSTDGSESLGMRAASLVPELRKLAREAEELRRVPDESISLVRNAGLLRVLQARRTGGEERSMREHLDVISNIAEGCVSTAWVAGVVHAHSWVIAHMSPEAQEDAYGANPNNLVAAVIGPRGRAVQAADHTFVLEGFWPFGSGCRNADWMLLGAKVFDKDGAEIDEGDFLIPIADIEIKDDWHVAGLVGTGSSSVVVKDLAVPAHRFISFPKLLRGESPGGYLHDGWLYRAAPAPLLALCLTGSALGVARASLRDFCEVIENKVVAYTTDQSQTAWTATHLLVSRASAKIRSAELLLYKAADDIDAYARQGEDMPVERRAQIRLDGAYAVRQCLAATDELFLSSGGSGLRLSSSLQKAARDLHAINMHGLLSLDTNAELYGQVRFGLQPNGPLL